MSQLAARFAIPAGILLVAAQSSLVSVYGGQRAIIFDRFQGVKPQVSLCILFTIRSPKKANILTMSCLATG